MRQRLFFWLSRALSAAVALLLIWAVVSIFLMNFYSYSLPVLALLALAALSFAALAWLFIVKNEAFLRRHSAKLTVGFLLLLGTVQIVMIFPLRYTPEWDVDAIFVGASEWALTGDFASYHEYFGMFHNNWGGLLLLRLVFGSAKLFGYGDFFLAASVFNCALSILTVFLTGSVCYKLAGVRGRMMAYLLFSVSLPFYFIAPAFYTDALTMPFPILIFRLYLAAREEKNPIKRLGISALMGLAAGMGFSIKATAAIMLIAAAVDAALDWDPKKAAALVTICAVMMLVCRIATGAVILRHLDRDEAQSRKIPLLHWVMMGSAGRGLYDPDEYEFTKSFEDPAKRQEAVRERLIERLKSYGAGDYAELFTRKLDVDLGDGTYGLSDCLGCRHGEDNALQSFLVRGGERHGVYKHICTGVLIALYALVIISCLIDIFGKTCAKGMFVPRLALFGLLLFLLVWEARWRYFSNHVPVIITAAACGLDGIFNKLRSNI